MTSPEKRRSDPTFEELNETIDRIHETDYEVDPKTEHEFMQWYTADGGHLLLIKNFPNTYQLELTTGRDQETGENLKHSITYTRDEKIQAILHLDCGQEAFISLCEGVITGYVLYSNGPIKFNSELQDAEIKLFHEIIDNLTQIINPPSTNSMYSPISFINVYNN